ncbi:hypothetical protein [Thalassoporum mexicanum]|uniref:hypothetical protein n=1 Tax=Thalassoporum mexicanum TaxID=3457544 RepID=UPI0012E9BBC0|nr:hypothetical protein [Pseudanabaena sp. PCC 7367]
MKISSRVNSSLGMLSGFSLAFVTTIIAIALADQIPIVAAQALPSETTSINKTKQNRLVPRPSVLTWQEFTAEIANGKVRFISTTYDLPPTYTNGYVYRTQGANWLGAYVIRSGLSAYPQQTENKLDQIDPELADRFMQDGNAIYFFWNRGNSARGMNRNRVEFTEAKRACLGATCVKAPGLSNAEIREILRSERNSM